MQKLSQIGPKIGFYRGVVENAPIQSLIAQKLYRSRVKGHFIETEICIWIFRQDGALNKENIDWLETVFRENVGEGQSEFTLEQFKKIVPSKNVRKHANPTSPLGSWHEFGHRDDANALRKST